MVATFLLYRDVRTHSHTKWYVDLAIPYTQEIGKEAEIQ